MEMLLRDLRVVHFVKIIIIIALVASTLTQIILIVIMWIWRGKAKAYIYSIPKIYMLAIGKIIPWVAMANMCSKVDKFIKDNLIRESKLVLANLHIKMAEYIKGIGEIMLKLDLVLLCSLMALNLWDFSIKNNRHMDYLQA